MNEPIKYISSVEIDKLWGYNNIVWRLNADVNVLSGKNGSGKSTVLDCVFGVIGRGELPSYINGKVGKIKIIFNNNKYIVYEFISGTKKFLEEQAEINSKYKEVLLDIENNEGDAYKKIKALAFYVIDYDNLDMKLNELHKEINIDVVSTFDNILVEQEAVRKLTDEEVKTELDWQIYNLQKKYLEYQLNIGKRAIEVLSKEERISEDVKKISYYKNLFLDILDEFFSDSGKKVNRDKNEIEFQIGNVDIHPYGLSSGEKQIVLILLTVLLQENKPSIIFLDEPEISLHFDWQRKLIEKIRQLNEKAQIILATHSPAVVMDGWHDKVSEIGDLVVKS
jgi:energy-coupling factor transporter ATP-binding protein EcfA2